MGIGCLRSGNNLLIARIRAGVGDIFGNTGREEHRFLKNDTELMAQVSQLIVTQINAVENPIINSPYDEPRQHWHIEESKPPEKQSGRRPASYFLRVPERAARGARATGQTEIFEEDAKGGGPAGKAARRSAR